MDEYAGFQWCVTPHLALNIPKHSKINNIRATIVDTPLMVLLLRNYTTLLLPVAICRRGTT